MKTKKSFEAAVIVGMISILSMSFMSGLPLSSLTATALPTTQAVLHDADTLPPLTKTPTQEQPKDICVNDPTPSYTGGYEAMTKFITKNLKYPYKLQDIEGIVYVSCLIGKTGKVTDVKVVRGLITECDQEAVRVVSMMPEWIPAVEKDLPVSVRIVLPIRFSFDK